MHSNKETSSMEAENRAAISPETHQHCYLCGGTTNARARCCQQLIQAIGIPHITPKLHPMHKKTEHRTL